MSQTFINVVCFFNIDLRVQHIGGCNNVIADALSRGKYDQLGQVTHERLYLMIYILFFISPCCHETTITTSFDNCTQRY